MNSVEWPDPVRVVATTTTHRGRTAWAVTTGSGEQHTVYAVGTINDAGTADDGRMSVLETLLTEPALQGVPVDLVVPDTKLRGVIADSRRMFPAMEPVASSSFSPTDADVASGKATATMAAEEAGPVVLDVGTDGARDKHSPTGGWGWVAADGRNGQGHVKVPSPVAAELTAISKALSSLQGDQPLRLLVDSKEAIKLASLALAGQVPDNVVGSLVDVLNKIRGHAGREIKIQHVLGHAGHPLNEGAHRLAYSARQAERFGYGDEQLTELSANVAEDVRSEYVA